MPMDSRLILELTAWWVVVLSLITFALFGADKGRAKRSAGRRIPEATLLGCCLLGGWPGGLLGMVIFRHKSSKPSFLIGFWLVTLVAIFLIYRILRLTGKL
jgi:uncharacterized membrane protein YsdA (DUF1294 family)